jgi:2-iminobutanoate/2-iminopropanoate deaminase
MRKLLIILILTISGITLFAQSPTKQVIFSDKAPKAIGPYSQAIMVGNTLYLSGQIAINPESGKMDTLTIEAEIKRVLDNLGEVLKSAGMSYENVVKCTIFTTDLKNFKTINTIYGTYFIEKHPARETVQVVALPGKAHVEISAIAVKDMPRPPVPDKEE